ncbi:hypothetical protein NQ420_27730, partial [Escherichia coli]|nr:hypothetical protein [Escherichia coli]
TSRPSTNAEMTVRRNGTETGTLKTRMSCLIRSGANIGSGGHRSPPLSIIRHRSTPQPAGAAIDRIQEPAQRRIVSGAAGMD